MSFLRSRGIVTSFRERTLPIPCLCLLLRLPLRKSFCCKRPTCFLLCTMWGICQRNGLSRFARLVPVLAVRELLSLWRRRPLVALGARLDLLCLVLRMKMISPRTLTINISRIGYRLFPHHLRLLLQILLKSNNHLCTMFLLIILGQQSELDGHLPLKVLREVTLFPITKVRAQLH